MPALEPPNRGALWLRLALTPTQVAELCGVSPRQVLYWTRAGYITAAPGNPGRYNGNAVDLCLLIKQGRAAGLPLERAAAAARDYLTGEAGAQAGLAHLGREALLEVRGQLVAALATAASVREVVEARVPEGAVGEP